MPSIVSCIQATYDGVLPRLAQAIALCGGLQIGNCRSIAIKINICDARTVDTGAVTHPVFLDALLHYLRERLGGIPIDVVESDGAIAIADEFVQWFGYQDVLDRWGARFVNLSRDRAMPQRIKGLHLAELPLPNALAGSYLISLAKLKTNPMSQITCALKNQFGCLPEVDKGQYHPVLDRVIADVNLAYRPDFCIIDGILGHGGIQGPNCGIPIPAGIIIAGADPVAVDTCCARVIGIPPWLVGHIGAAARAGVGSPRYRLLGDPLPRVNFHASVLGMLIFRLGVILQKKSRTRTSQHTGPASRGSLA